MNNAFSSTQLLRRITANSAIREIVIEDYVWIYIVSNSIPIHVEKNEEILS